jgi:N-acetylglutamate synthase-like GNAT family acetyltransferase
MQIRRATSSDFLTIQALAHQIWPTAYAEILSQKQLQYMLDLFYTPDALSLQQSNGQQFYLLEVEGTTIGFAALEFDAKPRQAKLHKLYLQTALQNRGYGKFFMEFCMQQAKEAGQLQFNLNVNRFNKAIQFYRKIGFEITDTVDIAIGNGYFMEDYIMEINL